MNFLNIHMYLGFIGMMMIQKYMFLLEIETQLLPGEDTSQRRPCNSLAGVSIDNQFMPLVKNLKDNVQEPHNIIQEVADDKWIRGGIPSRQFVKDIDYIERCQDKYKNKQYIRKRMKYN